MNLQLNDPSVPGPGEMVADSQHTQSGGAATTASPQTMATSPLMVAGGDPHHNRAPSLGELHQELEAEQEAQVVSAILLRSDFTSTETYSFHRIACLA